MPFDQVREGQEGRGNQLQVSRLYTIVSSGQKTEAAIVVAIIILCASDFFCHRASDVVATLRRKSRCVKLNVIPMSFQPMSRMVH